MPKTSDRGEQRRADLVDAGLAVLAESGWSGVTQRAVAARAGANAGLVHYYFNGSSGLRVAVAEAAVSRSIGAALELILGAEDDDQLIERITAVLSQVRSDQQGARITAEVVSATFTDPQIAALVRAEFRRGRERVQHWLREQHPASTPGQARGAAAVIVAAVDGLSLHLMLDPDLPLHDVTRAVRHLGTLTTTPGVRQERRR